MSGDTAGYMIEEREIWAICMRCGWIGEGSEIKWIVRMVDKR
jgi:hypothetical protein